MYCWSSFRIIRNAAVCVRACVHAGPGQGPWRWMEMTVGKSTENLEVKEKGKRDSGKGKRKQVGYG
jgi:hypothetical protein